MAGPACPDSGGANVSCRAPDAPHRQRRRKHLRYIIQGSVSQPLIPNACHDIADTIHVEDYTMIDLAFGRLNQQVFGYWHAQPLFALADLGVFDALTEAARPAVDLARQMGCEPRAFEGLLNAGTALGLLTKSGEDFANSESSKRFLVTGSPETLIHWVRVMGRWAEPWTRLRHAIETGKPIESQALRLGADPAYLEDFILGMHEYARRSSGALAAAVDLSDCERLLDIGGGAGTYAISLAQANPRLHIRLLDLPPVLPIARRIIGEHDLAARITTGETDYQRDSFGSTDTDAVLFSNVLHQEAPEICISMLQRGSDALKKGGRVLVHGHFLDESRTAPLFTTLHNLSAYALWSGGRSYTVAEMSGLMAEAGFSDIRPIAIKESATTVVEGVRA
jgi:predicted O-methyltransferase YrrM